MRPRASLCSFVVCLLIAQPLAADWSWPWTGKSSTNSSRKSKAADVTIRNKKKDEPSMVSRMTDGTKRAVTGTKNKLTQSTKKTTRALGDKLSPSEKTTPAMGSSTSSFKSLFVREESHPSKTVRDFMQAERVKP